MQLSRDRRRFLKHLGGLCGAFPVAFRTSQNQGRGVRRIGFIIGNATPSLIEAFRDGLRRLGHVEGKNLFLDLRIASLEDMPKHAAELAKSDLELVVASALPSALEIRRANPAMPMVITTCPGMVSNRFAKSLEHPGGNVTGMEELPPVDKILKGAKPGDLPIRYPPGYAWTINLVAAQADRVIS